MLKQVKSNNINPENSKSKIGLGTLLFLQSFNIRPIPLPHDSINPARKKVLAMSGELHLKIRK